MIVIGINLSGPRNHKDKSLGAETKYINELPQTSFKQFFYRISLIYILATEPPSTRRFTSLIKEACSEARRRY